MSKLDLDYFETLIAYKSLTDETYLASIIDYIKPIYFKNKDIKVIFGIISDFYEKRNTKPTVTEIKSYLITEELKTSLKNVVQLFNNIEKNLNPDELATNTETFLKEKAVYHTMMEVVDDINKSEVDTSKILEKFEKACSLSLTTEIGLDLFTDIDRVITDLNSQENYISSGWKWLDDKIGGGFLEQGRSLYLFAGETNIGKSIFLGNVAVNMANQGKTVLLVSLEMPELVYAKRLCSSVSKIPLSQLRIESESLKNQINEYCIENPNSKLIIKEFPPATITANHLKAFVKKLIQKGIHIDAIVLDYVNLLRSTTGDSSYERIKICTEQLRALSYTFSCPIISATQLNREGYETSDPGLKTISESIGLAMTGDVILSIWQEDTDKELGVIKMGFMKNRFGPNFGHCAMRIDYSTLTITEDEHINDTEASTSSISTLAKLALDI
jgi:replicative DNA helicase